MARSAVSRLSLIFVLAALVSALAAGGAYLYVQDLREAEAERQRIAALAKAKAERAARLEEVQSLFDTYLNSFIKDLKIAMREYRADRSVLPRMIAAYNFQTPEYAKENYVVFVEDVSPSLRKKADDVLSIFSEYNEKVATELNDDDDDIAQDFARQWNEMSEEQLESYVDYFVREDALISAYGDLMRFYVRYSNLYSIDPEDEVFIFQREEDEEKHLLLLQRLSAASADTTR